MFAPFFRKRGIPAHLRYVRRPPRIVGLANPIALFVSISLPSVQAAVSHTLVPSMAIGGVSFEARNNSVISGGGSDIEAMAEQLSLADGLLTNQSIVKALGRFAEAAASSSTVSRVEQATHRILVWRQYGDHGVDKPWTSRRRCRCLFRQTRIC